MSTTNNEFVKSSGSKLEKSYRLPSYLYLIYNLIGLTIGIDAILTAIARELPESLAQAGHFQFLTNISLVLTIITMISNIFFAIIPPPIKSLQTLNVYINAISIVSETIVSTVYWGLKIFARGLIVHELFPKERFMPLRLDLTVHLFPLVFLSIDYYLIRKKSFQIPSFNVFILLVVASGSYWAHLETLIVPPAVYPYPFLDVKPQQRAVVFLVIALLGLVFYHIYEFLQPIIQNILYKIEKELDNEKKDL
ncbi:hypothetical protein WICMUC_002330 [Wickerhamomyces mucosus]|uniref:Uncharacterized protein n=1 Tax=Wickerhamomyces mucosus TaxID=1378264 RepID=A0A9P8PRK4_9ASCO|nr:hypothetical protein WICMUC_002330 [Wickerhamomyces mucosus]